MIQDSSRSAYMDIYDSLGYRQKQIYHYIEKVGDITNLEISNRLGIPINQVTPRVHELRDKGLVVQNTLRECSISKRTVMSWRIN